MPIERKYLWARMRVVLTKLREVYLKHIAIAIDGPFPMVDVAYYAGMP